jgi:hypothetical protein
LLTITGNTDDAKEEMTRSVLFDRLLSLLNTAMPARIFDESQMIVSKISA